MSLRIVVLALLAVGCDAAIEEDGRDDAFLGVDGKADAAGVIEGSPQAVAVLELVNQADHAMLAGTVGVPARSSRNIVGRRAGADGKLGTPDDRFFQTLAELDAVPWVGPVTFDRLLDYVEAHGLVAEKLVAAGSCHEVTQDFNGEGVCSIWTEERDLLVRAELTVRAGEVSVTSIREDFDQAQYLCRVLQGTSCSAVMASPIGILLDADGKGHVPFGRDGYFNATLDAAKLDLTFAVEGDRRELVCRGVVERSFCTLTAMR